MINKKFVNVAICRQKKKASTKKLELNTIKMKHRNNSGNYNIRL